MSDRYLLEIEYKFRPYKGPVETFRETLYVLDNLPQMNNLHALAMMIKKKCPNMDLVTLEETQEMAYDLINRRKTNEFRYTKWSEDKIKLLINNAESVTFWREPGSIKIEDII